ncbi:MAG: hypothetical protein ACOZCO_04375 [Bacteroidota bacterium]
MPAKLVKILRHFLVLLAMPVVFFSCKNDNPDQVPNVLVDIQVNINNPGYINLQAPGGWMYFEGGSKGIIVYRRSADEFVAMDRHCTYQTSNGCQVRVDTSSNVIAIDDCCGSRFIITDGSVSQGPAVMNLKLYQTYYDGAGILRIYN